MKKVVIIGPESTGKSTLCGQLAQHYDTVWVPEYARQYLLTHGKHYTYDDLLTIAKGQVALEEEYIQSITKRHLSSSSEKKTNDRFHLPFTVHHSSLLFIDTNMYVMKVWCEFVFEQCHSWILNQIVQRNYDLYLLCNIDLPWVKDELREYPDLESRKKLYYMYTDIMANQTVPWVNISGDYSERKEIAIRGIDQYLH